jgi:hypothetical protein
LIDSSVCYLFPAAPAAKEFSELFSAFFCQHAPPDLYPVIERLIGRNVDD